jgi:hypothetical protein
VPEAAHFVQFYRDDSELIEALRSFVADGVWRFERVLIIATPEHRALLEERLQRKQLDLGSLESTRQVTVIDARECLRRFIVNGRPDGPRFFATVGEDVRQRIGAGRRLRAFGEMVDVLWRDGNREGALELEALWNDLGRDYSFTLFCAYATDRVAPGSADEQCVCALHQHFIPATA